jgi:hypothetical protein
MNAKSTVEINFEGTSEIIQSSELETLGGWQVIVKCTNKHGVGLGGKIYARVGLTEVLSQLMGVLPGQTTTIDFRHNSGPITKIYIDELSCTHSPEHVFSMKIDNPINGKIYTGTVNP